MYIKIIISIILTDGSGKTLLLLNVKCIFYTIQNLYLVMKCLYLSKECV